MFAVAAKIKNIWIPPNGRPYWVGGYNAGPHLTDAELDRENLSAFKKHPYSKVWAESHEVGRRKQMRSK